MFGHSPSHDGMVAAILAYLALFDRGSVGGAIHLHRLAATLDALVMASHRVAAAELILLDEPPVRRDGLAAWAMASFPELGCYDSVDPGGGRGQPVETRHAIDDLLLIAGELAGVLWYIDNVGREEAMALFGSGYRLRWGRALHEVRRYLHALMG